MVRSLFLALSLSLSAGWSLTACQGAEKPPYLDLSQGPPRNGGSAGSGLIDLGGLSSPPRPLDTTGLCLNEVTPILLQPPNLYFVLDRSGSMLQGLPGSHLDKYRAAEVAIVDVLRQVGHRVRYGATTFPSVSSADLSCGAGTEIQETSLGDPYSYSQSSSDGPILSAFIDKLHRSAPAENAGTPTAAALRALEQSLPSLEGTTFVVLLTDGAPNCNEGAACGADACLAHIVLGPDVCGPGLNCCSPDVNGPNAPLSCFDRDPTLEAVTSLFKRGIRTYVIGMPGSEPFALLLSDLAVLGGTARTGSTSYYAVSDTAELANSLAEIATGVIASCTLELAAQVRDPSVVNVFLDTTVLASDPEHGWTFTAENQITLHGAACERVKAGNVQQVQLVAGCPTVIR